VKQELQELVWLTELYFYENYPILKRKTQPALQHTPKTNIVPIEPVKAKPLSTEFPKMERDAPQSLVTKLATTEKSEPSPLSAEPHKAERDFIAPQSLAAKPATTEKSEPSPLSAEPHKVERDFIAPQSLAAKPATTEKSEPSPLSAEPHKVERDFSDIEKIFLTELSHIKLLKTPPDDSSAKQKAEVWKHSNPIAYIIVTTESEQELKFLQNVANSITRVFGLASLIRLEDFNENHIHPNLKCCLINQSTKSIIAQKNLPTIYFSDKISDYFTNPLLKAHLWKAITAQFRL
jgi:hypothetical protein